MQEKIWFKKMSCRHCERRVTNELDDFRISADDGVVEYEEKNQSRRNRLKTLVVEMGYENEDK